MAKGRYYGRGTPGGTLKEITGTPDELRYNRQFEWRTKAEANAFVAGISLVNDSSIEVIDTRFVRHGKNGKRYIVLVQDDDYHEETD